MIGVGLRSNARGICVELKLDSEERESAERLVTLALAEDLGSAGDLTSVALIDKSVRGTVNIVARKEGILAGLPMAEMVFQQLDQAVSFQPIEADGTRVAAGAILASGSGPLRSLLTGERTVLNFLMHLSGIATRTRQFVDAIAGSKAVLLDTRKTLPAWRRLEKYAVRAGGGTNHRIGLFDGCLIKDNHLAAWIQKHPRTSIARAIETAREAIPFGIPLEVEVDSLEQLREALTANPDIVLLDNMNPETIAKAVRLRDGHAPGVLLEASGGVTLETVEAIAKAGVDRISVGAITHSAPALDMAFDWPDATRGAN
jgi:nicotinate-nucleotide pyrophosphorylase (carboxylating)